MKPAALHFDWLSFIANVKSEPPPGDPPEVSIYTDQVFGANKGMPVLMLRLWYRTPRGIIGFIGDKVTGPQTIWSLIYADLIRAGRWAALEKVKLCFRPGWADDWDEVQP